MTRDLVRSTSKTCTCGLPDISRTQALRPLRARSPATPAPTPAGRCCLWPPGRGSGPCPAIWCVAPVKPAHAVCLIHRALRPCDRFALVRRQRRLLRPSGRCCFWPPGRGSGLDPRSGAQRQQNLHMRFAWHTAHSGLATASRSFAGNAGSYTLRRLRFWPPGRGSGLDPRSGA